MIYEGKGRKDLPSGDIATPFRIVNSPLFWLQQKQPIPDQLPTNYPNQQYLNNIACNSKSVKYNFFCALIYGGKEIFIVWWHCNSLQICELSSVLTAWKQPIPDQLLTNYPNQGYLNNTACNSKRVKYNFFCALIYGGKGKERFTVWWHCNSLWICELSSVLKAMKTTYPWPITDQLP